MIGELFDPNAELCIDEHYRPHWSQSGAVVFVTFRTIDSIPREVLSRWHQEKLDWLQRKGVSFRGDFPKTLSKLSQQDADAFRKRFSRQREVYLDGCRGRCVLRDTDLAAIVRDSLLHFDRDRYRMGDFVVMPNHVHLLAAFADEHAMRKQFSSWLHWTARQINQQLGSNGCFWQEEPFDHLVRSDSQYVYLKQYIRDNPMRAGLREGEYLYHACGA